MKLTSKITTLVAAAGLVLGAGMASAEDAGMYEYMNSCAACHGTAGDGNGPMMELISVRIPDLTMLSANNDGAFPMLEVIHMIDGRSGLRGHGSEMPIWGGRYKAEVEDQTGEFGAELLVRGRVLSLAMYLETLQK